MIENSNVTNSAMQSNQGAKASELGSTDKRSYVDCVAQLRSLINDNSMTGLQILVVLIAPISFQKLLHL